MTKRVEKQLRYFKYSGEPVRFRLGTLLVIILAVQLLVVSAFTEINFKHLIFPLDIFSNWSFYFPDGDVNANGFVRHIQYIPQVPMLFFLLGLLDKKYSLITVGLYIIAGFIGYPIFSMGGGWKYIFQYGVGYILAYIPTIWVSGTILDRNFSFKNVVKSVLLG
ncbi:biotin transporter BioY, partial [bacterium]|nr:biotin transporter BioY [bacterium]